MEADARNRADMKIKPEDDSGDARMADDKPTYRSWKKKYRKMRIIFDQKMHEGEELHKLEEKALATCRRLAVQKDRLLDLLLDVNNSPQIPPEKRIDLSLDPPSDEDELCLGIDRPSTPAPGPAPLTSYKNLLQEVPHFTFSDAAERFPELFADLQAGRDSPADPAQGQPHPPTFLTADDIDNYIWEIDTRLADKEGDKFELLPTLAPLARTTNPSASGRDSQRDFALRNPVSVYNWLRKHAPKTFLQDAEHHKDKDKDTTTKDSGDEGGGSARRGKGERAPRGTGTTRSKRASAAHSRAAAAAAAAAESLDDFDDEFGYAGALTPSTVTGGGGAGGSTGAAKGKRKRAVDDDPGYRPKGGSSRPAKKKKKSSSSEKGDKGAEADARQQQHEAASSTKKGPKKSSVMPSLPMEVDDDDDDGDEWVRVQKVPGPRKSGMEQPAAPPSGTVSDEEEDYRALYEAATKKGQGPRKSSMPSRPTEYDNIEEEEEEEEEGKQPRYGVSRPEKSGGEVAPRGTYSEESEEE
ncbi:hypothetical protein VTK56DRAFT_6259 [Thermocarpiscus australiensis]